mgnify:CR=1 FL=1
MSVYILLLYVYKSNPIHIPPPLTTHVVTDGLISDGLWDIYNNKHMGTCGDLCATTYNISREAQDEFAIGSYEKAKAAWETPVSIRIVCI